MSSHASELLAALPESCSLFLEQACPDLTLRSHDGTLHNNEQLVTVNGQAIALATTQGDGGLVPESGMCEMANWLEAGHRHFICSAAVQPVARAILNIWPLDPYLARHFLMTFTPCCRAQPRQITSRSLPPERIQPTRIATGFRPI